MEEFWGGDSGGDTPVSVTQATPDFLACGARDTRMSCLSMAVCNSFFLIAYIAHDGKIPTEFKH